MEIPVTIHKQPTGRSLCVFLLVMWVLTQSAKLVLSSSIGLHVGLAILFCVASLLLAAWTFAQEGTTLRIQNLPGRELGVFSPEGRIGYRICTGYFLLTTTLFILARPHSWSWELPQLLEFPFRSTNTLLAVLGAPIYEELFFRGSLLCVLQRILFLRFSEAASETDREESIAKQKRQSTLWAIYLSALIFWAFHMPADLTTWKLALSQKSLPLSPGSFLLGLLCAWITTKERSIWMAILFHAEANLLGVIWAAILPAGRIFGFFYSY